MYNSYTGVNNMKKIIAIVLVVVLSGLGLYFASSSEPKGASTKAQNTITDNNKIIGSIGKGATLIDVRTAGEYDVDHAVGAINVSLDDIKSGKIPLIAKDSLIYVYCHSGARAESSKVLLQKAGYSNVVSLKTLYNWVSMGGKVTGSASVCKINRPEKC